MKIIKKIAKAIKDAALFCVRLLALLIGAPIALFIVAIIAAATWGDDDEESYQKFD